MGTIVDNKISEILLTSVETSVQLSTSYLCPSTSDSEEIQSDTHSTDVELEPTSKTTTNCGNKDTVVCTEITVEAISDINHEEVSNDNSINNNNSEIVLSNENSIRKSTFNNLIDSDTDDDEVNESNQLNVVRSDLSSPEYELNKKTKKKAACKIIDFESSDENDADLPPRKKSKSKIGEQLEPRKITTGREAVEQKREIISESQRMLRESRVSLPYHKPKPRSIKEFMASRPKIADSLPGNIKNMPAVNAIKVTSKLPEEIAKKIEERTKKAEKFYQSSESSDDEIVSSTEDMKTGEPQMSEEFEKIDSKENEQLTTPEEIISNEQLSSTSINYISLKQLMYECTSDLEQLKNELVKSFLNPSKLKNDTFEEQDLDTELISELEVSKIIDTLGNEEIIRSNDFKDCTSSIIKPVELTSTSKSVLKFINTSKWVQGKTFDLLSDSEDTGDPLQQSDTLFKTDIKPTLRGNPNEIINLDDDDDDDLQNNGNEDKDVNSLLNRFIKHTAQPKSVINEMNVTDVNGKDNISMNFSKTEEKRAFVLERPGAKLQRLREDLKKKIISQKSEEWNKRQKTAEENMLTDEEKELEDLYEGEKEECGMDTENNNNNNNEDENDENLETDEDMEDEDEIEEGNYDEERSKKKTKSAFIDDEAEDTEFEDEKEEDIESEKDEEEIESDEEVETKVKKKTKVLRRKKILEVDDSDSDNSDILSDNEENMSQKNNSRSKIVNQMDCNIDSDSEFPLGQPNLTTPKKNIQADQDLDSGLKDSNTFISLIPKLNALQNTSLDQELIEESSKLPVVTPDPSPLRVETNKLCFDNEINTQENMDELLNLCSGTFCTVPNSQQPNPTSDPEFILSLPSQLENIDFSKEKSVESDLESLLSHEIDVKVTNSRIVDSSDEECEGKTLSTKKKLNKPKLIISDDETSVASESEISENEEETPKNRVIGYDSEENEIFEDEENEKNVRPSDFFEAEAELSDEENFDSADENEDDLDVMEREEGDDEKLNHRKLQRELERIHIKHVLEKDKHDVRLIQEILLEDGDLHSEKGRERKFRWKNESTFDFNEKDEVDNDEEVVDLDDVEAEQQYRRMRYEREKFLREKENSENLNNENFKLNNGGQGFKIISECTRKIVEVNENNINSTISPIVNLVSNSKNGSVKSSILDVVNKRGSFLSRGKEELNRIAAFTKEIAVGGVKNSNNFVFSTVDSKGPNSKRSDSNSSVSKVNTNKNNKRKAPETMPLILKKLCMNNVNNTSTNSS